MAVYVDPAKLPYGTMIMCHMVADTEAELHEMAAALGINRVHYHNFHYNVSKNKREKAISLGAVRVTTRAAVLIRRKLERAVTGACLDQPIQPKPQRNNHSTRPPGKPSLPRSTRPRA